MHWGYPTLRTPGKTTVKGNPPERCLSCTVGDEFWMEKEVAIPGLLSTEWLSWLGRAPETMLEIRYRNIWGRGLWVDLKEWAQGVWIFEHPATKKPLQLGSYNDSSREGSRSLTLTLLILAQWLMNEIVLKTGWRWCSLLFTKSDIITTLNVWHLAAAIWHYPW